jgi:DUF1680 family protein
MHAGSTAADAAGGTVREMVPFRRLPLGSVRPLGWMLAQMRRDLDRGFAGVLDALSPHAARDLFSHRLDDASGHTGWWDAETRGNWLWGYTMLAHLSGTPVHRERADALIGRLRATQDANGYIGIYAPAARYPAGGAENGELWAQSRAILALVAHHELTGDAASLESARRTADLTLRKYDDSRPHFARTSKQDDRTGLTHGLCYVDALEVLEECGGDGRYREFARWLLADFDSWVVPFPNDDLAAANLEDPHRCLRGHAVHTVEHLRALGAAGASAGRVEAALRKLRASTTPSGAVIGDESLHGLPTPGAAYEYCTLTELTFSLGRLARLRADPVLAEWMERVVFNAAQGARSADGRSLAYLCCDTRTDALAARVDSYSLLTGRHGRFKLSPAHDDVACCCNPNATRLLPHYVGAMWAVRTDAPGLVALAYGPCELHTRVEGRSVAVRQQTAYPFEDVARFVVEVDEPVRMSIWLRRPTWAAALRVDGVASRERDGWIEIEREWRASTAFEIHFDARVRVESYPGGELAVLRGPLQFVQPIAHTVRTLTDLALPGWRDEELLPRDIADVAAATPVLETFSPDLGLVVESDPLHDPDDPWQRTPLHLVRPGLDLVPIGCAPLRRAAFLAAPKV